MRTLGFVTCPNALRDAGASSGTCLEEAARRLDNDARTTPRHYQRPTYLLGLELNRTSSLIDAPASVSDRRSRLPDSGGAGLSSQSVTDLRRGGRRRSGWCLEGRVRVEREG